MVLAPPALYVGAMQARLPAGVQLAVQNIYDKPAGAYTGELSAPMLRDVGVAWALVGHSERRQYFGETSAAVACKTAAALESGLRAIVCVGETLQDREAGSTFRVLEEQLAAVVAANPAAVSWGRIVVAYEPVWAIGTGRVATPEQAQEVHAHVRAFLATALSDEVAGSVRIIYGGSVTAANAGQLIACEDIDGFLVGGASLKPEFAAIVEACAA